MHYLQIQLKMKINTTFLKNLSFTIGEAGNSGIDSHREKQPIDNSF